ncbi:protein disulfide-isomerase precursor [Phlyctochytrium bullatum]|nr:protein disulfide-isomerase precursor [Phlyctochytrium bullatum]
MKFIQSIAAFAAFLATAVSAHAGHDHSHDDKASDVTVLTKKNFSTFVNKEDLSLVEFYAPLAPEYEVAATSLLSQNIKLAKVDCTVETDVCSEHDIRGYPTLKVFRKGKSADYKGQRKSDSIVSYMKKQALPALSELKADKIEEFAKSDKVVVVGYFSDKISKKFKAFEKVANELRDDFVFGFTNDKVDAVKPPAIVLFKTFDEGKNEFDGKKWTEESIKEFVQVNSVPLMDDIGPENYGKYVEAGLPLAYLFVAEDDHRKVAGANIEKVAKTVKGKINFVYIDAVKFGSHAKNLNLEATWPALAIQEPESGLKYPYDQTKELSTEAVQKWVDDYLAGKVEPSLKSEPVPEDNDGPVKVVVGTTFDSIVKDKSKDVFLEVYAPWCGHCKKLAPVWDELGTLLKEDKNFVIAKMDGTENDLPPGAGFRVEGFPTLKLFKADTNEVVDFQSGDRTIEALLAFLKENATNGKKIKASVASSPRGHSVWIVTTAPERLFTELIEEFPRQVFFRNSVTPLNGFYPQSPPPLCPLPMVDPGVIQSDAVSVDVDRSFEVLHEFLGTADEVVERESLWLNACNVNCVLLDASFLPAVAAKRNGLPSILISNFTFDAIYEWISRKGNEKDELACATIRSMYDNVDYLLRLPGTIPIPSFDEPTPCTPKQAHPSKPPWHDASDSSHFFATSTVAERSDVAQHAHVPDGVQRAKADIKKSHTRTPSMKLGDTTATWSPKPKPRNDRQHQVLDLPLVVRMRRKKREEVRMELGIPLDVKVLLITFGGFAVGARSTFSSVDSLHVAGIPQDVSNKNLTDSTSSGGGVTGSSSNLQSGKSGSQANLIDNWTADGLLPPDWIGVFAIPSGAAAVIEFLGRDRFVAAPIGSYVPDLVSAADCVAGKCGYSTCAEVVAHGVPFIYVPRPQFAEEAGLLSNLMKPFGVCVEMPQESFYAGSWSSFVMKAHELWTSRSSPPVIPTNGDEVAVEAIENILEGRGLNGMQTRSLKGL